MNISIFDPECSYEAYLTSRNLVALNELAEGCCVGDDDLTPLEARQLADQLDANLSALPPEQARQLAISLIYCADVADYMVDLPPAELAVYQRLLVRDADSHAYHDPLRPGVIRIGLIAVHDLAETTGLSHDEVAVAIDGLLSCALLENATAHDRAGRFVRLPGDLVARELR